MIDSSKRKGNYVLVLHNIFYLFSFKYFCAGKNWVWHPINIKKVIIQCIFNNYIFFPGIVYVYITTEFVKIEKIYF